MQRFDHYSEPNPSFAGKLRFVYLLFTWITRTGRPRPSPTGRRRPNSIDHCFWRIVGDRSKETLTFDLLNGHLEFIPSRHS
jgi:hypothetical protein